MFNPFLSQCAGIDLDQSTADVAEINAAAFEDCKRLVDDVRRGHQSKALLLMGEPGSGKTHLLGRLQRWLDGCSQHGELSVFVPIRMVTNARMLWRLIREHLAKALLKRRADGCPLIHEVLKPNSGDEDMSRDITNVLDCLRRGERVIDAAAWLKGHELPSAALEALGLAASTEDEQQDATSQRIVTELVTAIAPIPVILCFDQIESIQGYAGDKDSFRHFGAEISALYDSTKNAAILSCLQTGLLNDFADGIGGGRGDSYIEDRLSKNRCALLPLTLEQSIRLAVARLDTDEGLRGERAKHRDPLWPLDEDALRSTFPPQGLLVARKVIARCSDLFEQRRDNFTTNVESDQEFLERSFQELLRPVSEEESEMVLRTGLLTLFRLRGFAVERSAAKGASTVEGVVEAGKRVAIAVCNQRPQGRGLTSRLRSLETAWPADVPELAIFRDARRGIGPGAIVTREVLANLESRGARLLLVEQEALAALKALNDLLADAKSGDLAYKGDSVGVSTVEDWLATHLPSSLETLLDGFTGQSAPNWLSELTHFVNEARVTRLEEAARQLEIRPEEVEEFVRLHPSLFGFAGGSTRILYRAAEPSA